MSFGVGGQADAGGMDFDFERGTVFELDSDGTLHIRSGEGSFALAPTGQAIAAMPPIAPAVLWLLWSASTMCCGAGVLMLLATSAVLDSNWSSRGQVVTLGATTVAAIAMAAASLRIWRHGRETRPDRVAVTDAVRTLTSLPVTLRQAGRFGSATANYLVATDGTAWAVHERSLYQGGRTA